MRELIPSIWMMHGPQHGVRLAYVGGALLLLLGTIACKNVQMADVTGTWTMNDSSRQVLPDELQKAAPKIVFNPDGTFSASELPGFVYLPGNDADRLGSGSGGWKLVAREGEQQIQLTFRTSADWNAKNLPYGAQLGVSKGWSRIELSYFLGDPDEGREIAFTKH